MDTATISYRVADFLKKYLPFQAMADEDVLELASRGRVRFHERHEHVLSQGEAHRHEVFVIQQGVVSLWDEVDGTFELRDVRGAGDLLGVERFNGAAAVLHSARAATDVVIYAFPADDFHALLDRYPRARQFVSAYSTVALDYHAADERRRPQDVFLHDVVNARQPLTCRPDESVRAAAQSMRSHGADAIAVVGEGRQLLGVLTASDLLAWIATGNADRDQPVTTALTGLPSALPLDASVAQAVLTMAAAQIPAVTITADGTPASELVALVTPRDLAAVFGDQPVMLVHDVRRGSTVAELRALNHRARAFTQQYLATPLSVDWLTHFTHLVDAAIVGRLIAIAGAADSDGDCWALCGAAGRGESLTRVAPEVVLITSGRTQGSTAAYHRVASLLHDCDYLPRTDSPFESAFYAASIGEWKERYLGWVRDPVRSQMYLARSLFDLRPVHGALPLWRELERALDGAVDRDFLSVLANDCLASLPPLTFFQDAVVDDAGEHSALFRLDHSAIQPLVDVARVFGMAAGRALGGSTIERLGMARRLLPEHEAIFREALDTFRIVLWLQGRVGIGQGTAGIELPPAFLSRHDRQILKSGFRVILRLIELTASWSWLDAIGRRQGGG